MSEETNVKLSKKQWMASFAILGLIMVILAIALYFMIQSISGREVVKTGGIEEIEQYEYIETKADNGLILHQVVTAPANISPEIINSNVTLSNKAGMNGGFFYNNDILSIAMVNGTALQGKADEYGSGGENVKYSRGTLVWDGQDNALSVQVVQSAKDIRVKDYSRFWAQGGISMSLQDDSNWLAQIEREAAPFANTEHLRSAIVYDDKGIVYLIVSETKATLEQFRDAIVQTVGNGQLVDGIFLDGDGSSQLNVKEKQLAGDTREVVQMIRILR
ncbi:phosphodiester glycosidase family protein [Paenibacillus yanchengensis]|uniref:Phosphodiester glycosidase family protein n=1 Tax=Paenibacillus yanchengensis TaxID=2035833 RepID=A0ABW4YM46_9BACL